MSQLTYTTICIAHSDKIGVEFRDINDQAGLCISKNGKTIVDITLSHKQLDLLLDAAEDYIACKPIMSEVQKFWEGK